MRAALFVVAVCGAGCTLQVADDPGPMHDPSHSDDDDEPEGGGLPPPACGQGLCSECVGCDVRDGLCFGLDWTFQLGTGHCKAHSEGSLSVEILGVGFDATAVGAVADDAYVQVGGIALGAALTLRVPAVLGTHDCTDGSVSIFQYYDGRDSYWNRPTSPRPACSVTLTAIGAVGALIEGAFSFSLVSDSGQSSLELTAGSFSVVRAPYP